MSQQIDTQALKALVGIVDKVPTHNAISASQFIKVTQGKETLSFQLSGLTSGQSSLLLKAEKSTCFYIDRRVLAAFAASASAKKVEFELLPDVMRCKAGRSKLDATPVQAVSGYCTWKAIPTSILPIDKSLRPTIATAAIYAPQSAAADHLSCVYVASGMGILSTDQHSMFFHAAPKLKTTVPLPLLLCSLVKEDAQIYADAQGMLLKYTGTSECPVTGQLYQTVSSRCADDFPLAALKKRLQSAVKQPACLNMSCKALADAVTKLRTFVFGADDSAIVSCTVSANETVATLTLDSVQGKVQERVKLESAPDSDVHFRWVISRLTPWLSYLPQEEVLEIAFAEHINIFRTNKKLQVLLQTEVV